VIHEAGPLRTVAVLPPPEPDRLAVKRQKRRQLLEYFFAFDVTGVLLVDMQAEKISEVAFPPIKGR
jgi:hypothetical protein